MGTAKKFEQAAALNEPLRRKVTMVESVNLALDRAMHEDENVVVLGEDVGVNGGVFRATVDLREKYGCRRVMDTPLAETLIAGLSVGMAAQGLRPVAEIQFLGFIYSAFEHIISHAARLRSRTRGRLSCPLVIRTPYGGGIHAPEHHCEAIEAMLAHAPGLRVVAPSSPTRAYGLLLSAIRDNDPVIFLEPSKIYRAVKHEVWDDGHTLPLDTCFTLREGDDITLVAWGSQIPDVLAAADALSESGISAEVIDVASIKPLDMDTILASVEKTGRCVIVHEATRSGGIGADIAANIQENALFSLKAPVMRVTGYDTPIPYFRQEMLYLPNKDDVLAAVQDVMSYR
ncbi:MAG TPA: alpha-ketoacid dehydrogenase subunit beta [Pseudomonadales bacterium]|nr:alpha-ketoacid dehydrogenase subunit beta [Pseudomonadales bacterium]